MVAGRSTRRPTPGLRTLPPGPPRLEPEELARLHLFGGADEAVGQRLLLETRSSRVLVDCGLGQGAGRSVGAAAARWSASLGQLDAVVLTQAGADHCGLLPALVRDGLEAPVHLAEPAVEPTALVLREMALLQEDEAERTNRRLRRQGRPPVRALSGAEDAERAVERLRGLAYDEPHELTADVRVRLLRSGHGLGAASVELQVGAGASARTLLLSGSLGPAAPLLVRHAERPTDVDLVVVEATQGDRRLPEPAGLEDTLAGVLEAASQARENVLVPCLATTSAYDLLHLLARLEQAGRLAEMTVVLDGPCAAALPGLPGRHADEFAGPVGDALRRGEPLPLPGALQLTASRAESTSLNTARRRVILAASEGCQSGRMTHHLKHHLWRRGTQLVFLRRPAAGTTGRALFDGTDMVRVRGQKIAAAARVHDLSALGGLADAEALATWVDLGQEPGRARTPVALVHGEDGAREQLAGRLCSAAADRPVWTPAKGSQISLRAGGEIVVRGP